MSTASLHRRRTRTRIIAAAALAAATTLTLGGCSTPAPTFSVVAVAVTNRTEEGSVVTFLLEGHNHSDKPAPVRTVIYTMTLDGRRAFHAQRRAEVTLPADGRERFRLPVVIRPDDMPGEYDTLSGRLDYALSASIEYEAPGTIAEALFDSGIRRPTVQFHEHGSLDFGS